MKPELGDELTISVRHEIAEAPAGLGALYKGIYAMTLAQRYEVVFIPEFGFSQPDRLVLPADFDAITSVAQARLIALATARFAVMADDARAGSHEVCTTIDWGDDASHPTPLLFYVAGDRFQAYHDELAELSGQFSGVHDSKRATTLLHYHVVDFVLKRVLPAVGGKGAGP